ncbi:MAG: HEAT repeat domain-containing protein [Planctomycetota bacterium]
MRRGPLATLAVCLKLLSSCAYLTARVEDLSDIPIVQFSWGPGARVHVEATYFLGTIVGYSAPEEITSPRLRDGLRTSEDGIAWLGVGLLGAKFNAQQFPEYFYAGPLNVTPLEYGLFRGPHRLADFSVAVHLVHAGLRLGMSLGEAADFFLGWFGADITRDDVAEYLDQLVNNPDVAKRRQAAEFLKGERGSRAAAAWIQVLRNDPDPEMRKLAAKTFARTLRPPLTPQAVSSLIEALQTESDAWLRVWAADALAREPSAVPQLIETLKRDPVPRVRASAASALTSTLLSHEEKAATDVGVAALLNALQEDPAEQVRAEAANALSYLETPEAIAILLKALSEDPSEKVREKVASTLMYTKDPGAQEALLKAATDDPAPLVRLTVVQSLRFFRDPRARDTLLRVKETDPDEKVRQTAEQELERTGPSP